MRANGEKHRKKTSARYKMAAISANKRKKVFTLSLEEYAAEIQKPCYYCNGHLGKVEMGIGLDRLDNSVGYITGNIVSCCRVCNTIKGSEFSPKETLVAVKAIINFRLKKETDEK